MIIKDSEKIIELKEDVLNNYIKANTDRNYELLMNLKAFHPDLKKMHEWAAKIKSFTDNFNTNAEKMTNIFEEKEFSLPQFTIRSSFNENKCIDTKNLNRGEFAQICDYQKDNKNQIFEMVKGTKEGYYSIRNHYSVLYLGIDFSTGDWRISFKKKSESPQNFKLIDFKTGFYVIKEESNYAVDLANFQIDNGSYVGFTHKNSSKAQQWKLILI